ncbi:MAG: DUF1638 domain-containing protein [Deltaproteobacteria bacterium]
MPVLGVLTCEILEMEFAHLLANDVDLTRVTVLEDGYSSRLIEDLEARGMSPNRIPILRGFMPGHDGGIEVLVRVLELALHNRKRFLQEGLLKAAREMGRYADLIFLGYGLCGNALQNPQELLADADTPIIIPMDEDHPVDDCVGLIIGGRETYYSEQCRVAGTFFMIPGWTRHWRDLFVKEYGHFDVEFIRRIFGMSKYERSLIIPTRVLSEEEMRENIAEFTRLFGFRTEVREGSLDILNQAWQTAKKRLTQGESGNEEIGEESAGKS